MKERASRRTAPRRSSVSALRRPIELTFGTSEEAAPEISSRATERANFATLLIRPLPVPVTREH
jgi:hypothetical protein